MLEYGNVAGSVDHEDPVIRRFGYALQVGEDAQVAVVPPAGNVVGYRVVARMAVHPG